MVRSALGLCIVWLVCFSTPGVCRAGIEQQPTPLAAPTAKTPELTRPPELLEPVAAIYPQELLQQNLAGEAQLNIDIDTDGAVERVEVQATQHRAFGMAAMDAATHFYFSPALIDHVPGAIRIAYTVHFSPKVAPPPPPEPAPMLLSGLVREAGSRTPVAHAAISVDGEVVAGTEADGSFNVMGIASGSVNIEVSHPDYEVYQVHEERSANQRLDVKYYLLRKNRNPYETVVRSKFDRHEVSKIELSRAELQKVPGTFGDPIRVIENLPGMGRAPVLGGQLLVRGANPSDTQVLVDGMPVPILYHFFGLTSVVNAEFLERIDFMPGGFGARYGRATAGIVDIVTRDLSCDLWHGTAKADFIDTAAYGCVPLGTWRLAAAARRSYIDALMPLVVDNLPHRTNEGVLSISPVYYDYQARARTVIPKHAIDISAFGSSDTLKVDQTGSLASLSLRVGLTQGFHRIMGRDRWLLGEKTTLTSTVSPFYEEQKFDDQVTEVGASDSIVADGYGVDWREDFATELLPHLRLNAGLDHTFGFAGVSLNFPSQTELQTFPTPTFDYANTQRVSNTPGEIFQAYWAELIYDLFAGLRLVPGLRLEYFHFGETRAFLVLPRATVRWDFIPGSTLKAAWGMYGRLPNPQYILPGWGNPSLVAERSMQFVAGYEQAFPSWVNLDVQGFYNIRTDLTANSRSITFKEGTAVQELYASTGVGRTYGLEVLLRRLPSSETNFYGWIAYTLSRSERRDHPLGSTYSTGSQILPYSTYDTQEYLSPFDQTHILTFVTQWVLPQGFEAGARFRLVSGNPTTAIRRGAINWDADADAYANNLSGVTRNGDRLPVFQQLDMRVDKTFLFDLWKLTAYLEVINAYFAKNVESFQYDYRFRGRVGVTLLPIVPVLGVKGEF